MSMEHLYWDNEDESQDESFNDTLMTVTPVKSRQRAPYQRLDSVELPDSVSPPLISADTNVNNNDFFRDKDIVPWPQISLPSCHSLPETSVSFQHFVILCGNCACSLDGRIISLPSSANFS